jgi:hypothetical protein
MITNDVFNFINTDRYSGAAEIGVTFFTSVYVYQICSNLPDNLFGYKPKLVIKDDCCSTNIIAECTLENNRAQLQVDRGIINFIVEANDTLLWPLGMFYYEITIESADNLIFRLAHGKFQISC